MDTMRVLGQDVNAENHNGETPLHQASLEGCHIAIDWLLANGADVEKTTTYGETPLHFACRAGQREAVLRLLEAGASLDIEVRGDSQTLTALLSLLADLGGLWYAHEGFRARKCHTRGH